MTHSEREAALAKEFQLRLDRKMREQEISQLEYWKAQLDPLVVAKPEGIAALQAQIRRVAEKMSNRIQMLKKGT